MHYTMEQAERREAYNEVSAFRGALQRTLGGLLTVCYPDGLYQTYARPGVDPQKVMKGLAYILKEPVQLASSVEGKGFISSICFPPDYHFEPPKDEEALDVEALHQRILDIQTLRCREMNMRMFVSCDKPFQTAYVALDEKPKDRGLLLKDDQVVRLSSTPAPWLPILALDLPAQASKPVVLGRLRNLFGRTGGNLAAYDAGDGDLSTFEAQYARARALSGGVQLYALIGDEVLSTKSPLLPSLPYPEPPKVLRWLAGKEGWTPKFL